MRIIPNIQSMQPLVTLYKLLNRKLLRLLIHDFGPVPGPRHPTAQARARPVVVVLGVEYRIGRVGGRLPHAPPFGINDPSHHRLQHDGGGVDLPWPPEVCAGGQVHGRAYSAPVDRKARVLVRVGLALGRDGVVLPPHRLLGLDGAVLEDGGRVPEDEVDGAGDRALAVELTVRVRVEGVLVAVDVAPVED